MRWASAASFIVVRSINHLTRRVSRCYFCSMLLLLQHQICAKTDIAISAAASGRSWTSCTSGAARRLRKSSKPCADPPTYSAVRAKLRVLEEKGHIRHEEEALRYVYVPVVARDSARRVGHAPMLSTFFDDSVEQAVAALLDVSSANLAPADLDRISRLIEEARKESKKEVLNNMTWTEILTTTAWKGTAILQWRSPPLSVSAALPLRCATFSGPRPS